MTTYGRKTLAPDPVLGTTPSGVTINVAGTGVQDFTNTGDIAWLANHPFLQPSGSNGAAPTTPVDTPLFLRDGVPVMRNPNGAGVVPAGLVKVGADGLVPDSVLGSEPVGLSGGFRGEWCPSPLIGAFANSDRTINNTGATRCYHIRHAPTIKRTTSVIHFAVKVASSVDDGLCIAGYNLATGARLWTTGRLTGLLNSVGQKRIALEVAHDPAVPIVVSFAGESANASGATLFGRSIGAADTVDIAVPTGQTPSFATGKLIGFSDAVAMPLPSTLPTLVANSVNTVPLLFFSEV